MKNKMTDMLSVFLAETLPHNSDDYIPDIVYDWLDDNWEELKEIKEYGI